MGFTDLSNIKAVMEWIPKKFTLLQKPHLSSHYSLCRDGRLSIGDEIVNVNGRRLRGLPMPEAQTILQNCLYSCGHQAAMDIVIARSSNSQMIKNEIIDQPLSLLAHYDEQDLINLSSLPLRPSNEDLGVQPTVIRIGKFTFKNSSLEKSNFISILIHYNYRPWQWRGHF